MTRLPNYENAYIDPAKLRDYVLASSHPIGRFKAALFRGLGYTQERWENLGNDIRQQHLELEAEPLRKTPYGQKYGISGFIKTPSGKEVFLKSIWIVMEGDDIPRFVTIYPEGG